MPEPSALDLQCLSALLRGTAREEIMPRFRQAKTQAKADGSLVTETDLAVQASLCAALGERWPGIPVLGEEMTDAQQRQLLGDGSGTFWCLDPLDGTSNYACGYPGFGISLALIRNGRAELAAVLDPLRDECYTAAHGSGAFVNDAPIAPHAPGEALGDCLAAVDMKRLPPERIAALFRPGSFRSQRNLGSVALEWCWLASGRFQLYLHGGQKLWDYAAGRLIADEAGVVSTLYADHGRTPTDALSLDKRLAVAAANDTLFQRWVTFIGLPLDG
ncbi:inositol monophosphatase family protein [Thiohalocapsa marina]|uniref:Inositol monophosphatase family protein n=1 Tax=Thiohalocapsa marina TaxID=424902 RepID=A0A5M8FFS3_9GAMM|nr:inositol monophosphatase family protein [Thiohalocapsa marina]KAA6183549.1 inositol monophosphatase family protein [Thiohalocapsa marina]